MTVRAKMILDSQVNDIRGCSIQMRYPKFIHGELMTHRMFSRNASSSRAIPVERLISDVIDDPAMPEKWFKNKPGMQGTEEIVGHELEQLKAIWIEGRDIAVNCARKMMVYGAHKQHVNRVIEPYCHINVLVTATNWSNFLALRDHSDADPTISALAREVRKALDGSKPRNLLPGEWHLPYVSDMEIAAASVKAEPLQFVRVSVARCARVSYLTQEGGPPNIAKDLELCHRLLGSEPLHASPAEHQFRGDERIGDPRPGCTAKQWAHPELGGNLGPGIVQFRKTLPNECR